MADPEIALAGGNVNAAVVRVGDTVRRTISRSSPAVHRLLLHLEAEGFTGSPRFLGIDDQGREILSYFKGEAGVHPCIWEGDEALVATARLLRRYHDATVGFDTSRPDNWAFAVLEPERQEVICHNDFAPYNFVFSGCVPHAVIDFDLAAPGPRLRDVGYAAYWMTPLSFSAPDMQPLAERDLAGGCSRLRKFCAAYGVTADRALMDMVMTVLLDMSDETRARAALGAEAAGRLRRGGHFEHWRREADAFSRSRERIESVLGQVGA